MVFILLEVLWLIFGIFTLDLHSVKKVSEKCTKEQKTGIKIVPEEPGKRSEGTPSVPRRVSGPGECSAQPSSQSPRSPAHNAKLPKNSSPRSY